MNLFIDTPERAAERMERRRQSGAATPQQDGTEGLWLTGDAGSKLDGPRKSDRERTGSGLDGERRRDARSALRSGSGCVHRDSKNVSTAVSTVDAGGADSVSNLGGELAAQRGAPTQREGGADPFDLDEVPGYGAGDASSSSDDVGHADDGSAVASDGPVTSTAGEAYLAEKAYHRRRARRRKTGAVVRTLAMVLIIPLAMVAVFVASYALTCIVNGASFEELGQLMGELASNVGGFVQEVLASFL